MLWMSTAHKCNEPGMGFAGIAEIDEHGVVLSETDYACGVEYQEIAINDFHEAVSVFTDGLGGELPSGMLESVEAKVAETAQAGQPWRGR